MDGQLERKRQHCFLVRFFFSAGAFGSCSRAFLFFFPLSLTATTGTCGGGDCGCAASTEASTADFRSAVDADVAASTWTCDGGCEWATSTSTADFRSVVDAAADEVRSLVCK